MAIIKSARVAINQLSRQQLGHVDLLGTETYLSATPELMELAANRFRRRYERSKMCRA
jgi:hypothetical protein